MKKRIGQHNIHLKEIAVFLFILSFGSAYFFTQSNNSQTSVKNTSANPEGEKKKSWSGRSFAAETDVELFPSPSNSAPGWNSERVWSGEDDWEPYTAVDRSSDYVYQLTTRFTAALSSIIFRSSSDNGATWGSDKTIAAVHQWQADPQIQVADDGTIYAVWLDGPDWKTKLTKSSDHGDTWTTPVDVAPNMAWTDHAWLVISPDGKDVYIGFNKNQIYFVASHDYGQTFSSPIQTSDSHGRSWMQVGGAISPNGDVHFACVNYPGDYNGVTYINLVSSFDGGASWITTLIDSSQAAPNCDTIPGCYYGFFSSIADVAVDQNGMIMLAYNAGLVPYQPQQIYIKSSSDGINWTERKQISHHNVSAWNSFPSLRAGISAGDFRIVWQGNKNGNLNGWNTFYRRTTDGGQTWSRALRLSNRKTGAPYKNSDGYQFTYGDYISLSVDSDGTNHVIWGEGTSYDGPGGVWYISGIESAALAYIPEDAESIDLNENIINKFLFKENEGTINSTITSFALGQNYPNPFNPTTKIKYTISSTSLSFGKGLAPLSGVRVRLLVYDVVGNEVATLVNEQQSPGTYEVEFNTGTLQGMSLSSGVYYYRLEAGSFVETKKMLLLK